MFGSSKATRLKNEAREDAKTRASRRRAEAAKARTAAEAGDAFREELVTCAAEAILSLRPEDEEAKAGWCQVALEASATLRSAALRRDPSAAGSRTTGNRSRNRSSSRRAASDASLRLIARLCAATKAAASEGSRPEAPGTHKAALRVLAALVRRADPRNTRAVRRTRRAGGRRVGRVSVRRTPRRRRRERRRRRARGTARARHRGDRAGSVRGGRGARVRRAEERRRAEREPGRSTPPKKTRTVPRGGASSSGRSVVGRLSLLGRGRVRHRRGGARVRRDSVRQVPLDVRRHGADAGRAHPRGRRGGVRGASAGRV